MGADPVDRGEEPGSADAAVEPASNPDRPPAQKRRRASLPAPAGSDPSPYDPPLEPRSQGENDDRLKADRPPHWDQGA